MYGGLNKIFGIEFCRCVGVGVVGVEGYLFFNLFMKVIFLKEIVLTL